MRKKMIILLQMIIAIILIGTSVYAAVTATLDLKVSASTVKKGEEVTVTLSLKNVDTDKAVKSISGYINYDEKVIEDITVNSIVKNSDNTVKIGDENLTVEDLTNATVDKMPDTSAYVGFNASPTTDNDVRIVIDLNSGIKKDTDLISIKFKVKSDATVGEVEKAIEYKMFVITAGSEKSEEISKNVKLTITDSQSNNGNNGGSNNNGGNDGSGNGSDNGSGAGQTQNPPANNTTNNTTNNTANKTNTNTNKTIDNTVAGTKIPAAGARVIVIPAIILILCAYISYNQYMKYKKI